ncbi:hypothetical protein QQS21_005344 [Conoideocrella luteorostrata]|uniref:Uncharacterized protein n=1 Tax=Conoideocrella luteorostrata TaxID=1105319 RepID=A0AAJ0CS61_9HYPO|nr:hypothetical protein QQS21_005344 [Conoideocrella luteorostrata]
MKNASPLRITAFAISAAAAVIYGRANTWQNKDGGNTKADLADHKVNYGTTPPWDALDQIKKHCLSNGCSSDSSFEVDTKVVKDDQLVGAKIKIAVGGSFNDAGQEGNLDQLVEIVKSVAAHSPYDVKKGVPYQVGNGCIPGAAGPTPCDPGKTEHADQYHLTDMIVVRVEGKDGDQKADMNVHTTIEVPDVGGGVCADITKVGGAMAGAINGILGGIFTLASLGCK